jgi:hypothetical protein
VSKPYSDADLSTQLSLDRTWRIREFSDLKAAIHSAIDPAKPVLLRSLVAICYAHWEGSIRFAARKYMEHVALRKLTYDELDRQYLKNLFLPRLAALSRSNTSLAERCALVESILESGGKRFSQVNQELINTQSNLSFAVFADICLVCAVPSAPFEDKQSFIDVFLLKRRNAIAHGEDTFVELADMTTLIDTTIELIRRFGDALENCATLKGYKAVLAMQA